MSQEGGDKSQRKEKRRMNRRTLPMRTDLELIVKGKLKKMKSAEELTLIGI